MSSSLVATDGPDESKRRRRFSSPFRRSRSRPRSVSVPFPSTISLVSTTSLTRAPTDVPDIPKAFQGRPHSYHAPDLGMHPAHRGSADQLTPLSPSYARGRTGIQASPTRTSFVSETEIQDDIVPLVPPIPTGVHNERWGRRSRSWGNASLMLQSAIRHATPPAKVSRSVGTSPIITDFDIPDSKAHQPHSASVLPRAPWNDDRSGKTNSPRAGHSSPITKGLWMGDTSPVLSKRTLAEADRIEDETSHQPVLPVYTDGTPAPADLVQLSEQYDGSKDTRSLDSSKDLDSKNTSDTTYEPLAKSSSRSEEEQSLPWPGTLLSTIKSDKDGEKQVRHLDEAPIPQSFAMRFSGEVSPLLRSSRASLQEVSDDDDDDDTGLSDHTVEQAAQRPNWETEVIGAGDVSDEEDSALNAEDRLRNSSSHRFDADDQVEQPKNKARTIVASNFSDENDSLTKTSNPKANSLHTIPGDKYGDQTSFDAKIIGVGDDVSPTSDAMDVPTIGEASSQAFDMQSALESKVVGADDVSPVSTRSSFLVATSSNRDNDHIHEDESIKKCARSSVEKFHTAGVGSDLEPVQSSTWRSDQGEGIEERPRIERFETAQEEVQGSSELTIPKVRQPASRYATVVAPEQVASYKEYTGSSTSSSDDLLQAMKPEASTDALTPQRAERAEAMPAATRQISASQLQVVHAVEEYAASNSSLASWDQESNSADVISEPGTAVEMKDESDLVTPVAQVPRNAHQGQQADQAENPNQNSYYAAPNGYFNGKSSSDSIHQAHHPPAPASNMAVPERSKSLLSMISSAVSSTPISPASSNAGRSTPSTIDRMQRDFFNAKTSNLTEVQIPEEPTSARDEQKPTARHEEYDLYADHNGVVKDVRDENGHPLRVDPTPNVAPAQLARTTTESSSVTTMPDTPHSRARRYSFERPMSFISGPQDDDGRPQDQINQPIAGALTTPLIPPQSKRRSQQYRSAPSGAIYSNIAPVQDTHWPPGEVTSQPPVQPVQQPAQEPVSTKVVRQPTRFVPHSHKGNEGEKSPAQQAPDLLPPQRTPPSIPSEIPPPNGQLPSDTYHRDRHPQNLRTSGDVQVQQAPRSVSAPLQHQSMQGQDPRVAGPSPGMSPTGTFAGPRNEFEYRQQMMQLPAKHPSRGTESQALNMQQPSQSQQVIQPFEKPSIKPRLAATIKGIVGRTSPNAPQTPNVPPAPSNLALNAPPTDASRPESFVSAASGISQDQITSASVGQSGVIAAPQQPPSLGAESHYNHVSHGTTQVQPAQSRQDPIIPAIRAQHENIHPQPQQQLALPQGAQSQNYRASTGTIPDAGKKKRFLAFTGLFGKGNAAAELQGKFKLSREEKKAQKAQRHTSQPILQSPPVQQWLPPHTHIIAPQQPVMSYASGQGLATAGHSAQPADPRLVPPHGPAHLQPQILPDMPSPQGLPHQLPQPQMQPHLQQIYPQQQQRPFTRLDEGSAYLRTKQINEERQARQIDDQPPRSVYETPTLIDSVPQSPVEQSQQPARQSLSRLPSNGYYYPEKAQPEQGAYRTSLDEYQRTQQQLRQQQFEVEQRLHADLPRYPIGQGVHGTYVTLHQQAQEQRQQQFTKRDGAYGDSQAISQQAPQQRQESGFEQGAYGATHEERQRIQQQMQHPLHRPEVFGRSQIHYDQLQQFNPPQRTNNPPLDRYQQITPSQEQPAMTREERKRQAEHELVQHRLQQQQLQLHQFHLQQQAQLAQQQTANTRSVSGPLLSQASPPTSPIAQRRVSSSMAEPQYETPPIPGAYGPVQGVFVSPLDREQHAFTTPHSHAGRQESDPQMQPISPQVSAQSQMPPNTRHHSDASTMSVVSPISGPTPEPPAAGPAADQRPQKSRMPSISEVRQQQPDRPWHMNFPAGTTEQDIVRARQKQFFQQQFASQQQAQAERHASSPSPRVSPDKQSSPFSPPVYNTQEPGGGFREVLPRTSPQPYPAPFSAPLDRPSHSPQPASLSPQEGAGWPLRSSPGPVGPIQPPPTEPHTPRPHGDFDQRQHEPHAPNQVQIAPETQLQYDEDVTDDAPPTYDGPGVPNDGMEKSNPDRPQPPDIVTAPNDQGRQQDGRPRQASLGLMQHPQPASMAASPQRTAPNMGAESLRRQMLQQEEHARMERIQRSQMQAAQRQREQQERDAARARARELERSVSGGGRVGSLRSVRGSHNGGTPGWERRGLQGGSSRPVFELPALEDEEPVMRATSFPGQEWVPPMYVDD
ncbi:uncharacterized protein EKO05_0004194 [Ascochyta rabiei]|uniref:uncharacterized protein n=1 Tax=Didymella rabiei TaxID=5454 RepID=UPI0022004A41|nr:uncharacterized protein EKO05_0004194 [Ascochyta rabiei]UPX13695.1 hypothetical protein EKO05_0004194 [Ascochyta rabiei]